MSTTNKTLRILIEGETTEDLIIALEEVQKKVADYYLSGFGSNDTGNYDFAVTEEVVIPVMQCGTD